MKLKFEALDEQLATKLAPLYVVSSDEHFLAQQALDKIRAKARREGFVEREILTVNRSFKWGGLAAANQSQSLFGDKKIIDLRIPTGKVGKEGGKALQDFVAQLKAHPNPDTVTLISLPKLDSLSQKSVWVTSLQNNAVYLDIPLMERAQLAGWITRALTLQGQSAEREAVGFIVDRVEGNLVSAHQEIQKLGLLYPRGALATTQIQEAVLNVARYDVFKLGEAILSGDVPRVVRMLDGLKGEGEGLPLVLWAVAEECRTLLKLKIGLRDGSTISDLCREHRIWGGRERFMDSALRRLSIEDLQNTLKTAAQVDKLIKGLRAKTLSDDPWDALLQLSLSLVRTQT